MITRCWLVEILLSKYTFRRVGKLRPKAYTVPTNFLLRNNYQLKFIASHCFKMIVLVGRTGIEPVAR